MGADGLTGCDDLLGGFSMVGDGCLGDGWIDEGRTFSEGLARRGVPRQFDFTQASSQEII